MSSGLTGIRLGGKQQEMPVNENTLTFPVETDKLNIKQADSFA